MSPVWISIAMIWAMVLSARIVWMCRQASTPPRGSTIRLAGETLPCEDWRVTGRRGGRPLTAYCVTRSEAEDARRHMTATGWRGVRIRRAS